MNTRIEYVYADADGFKTWGHVVIEGVLNFSQLRPFLLDGEFFVPELVGFPGLQGDLYCLSGGPTDADHPNHRLTPDDFSPTIDLPTCDLNVEDLCRLFAEGSLSGWSQEVLHEA